MFIGCNIILIYFMKFSFFYYYRSFVCEKIGIESEILRKFEIVEEVNLYFSISVGNIF